MAFDIDFGGGGLTSTGAIGDQLNESDQEYRDREEAAVNDANSGSGFPDWLNYQPPETQPLEPLPSSDNPNGAYGWQPYNLDTGWYSAGSLPAASPSNPGPLQGPLEPHPNLSAGLPIIQMPDSEAAIQRNDLLGPPASQGNYSLAGLPGPALDALSSGLIAGSHFDVPTYEQVAQMKAEAEARGNEKGALLVPIFPESGLVGLGAALGLGAAGAAPFGAPTSLADSPIELARNVLGYGGSYYGSEAGRGLGIPDVPGLGNPLGLAAISAGGLGEGFIRGQSGLHFNNEDLARAQREVGFTPEQLAGQFDSARDPYSPPRLPYDQPLVSDIERYNISQEWGRNQPNIPEDQLTKSEMQTALYNAGLRSGGSEADIRARYEAADQAGIRLPLEQPPSAIPDAYDLARRAAAEQGEREGQSQQESVPGYRGTTEGRAAGPNEGIFPGSQWTTDEAAAREFAERAARDAQIAGEQNPNAMVLRRDLNPAEYDFRQDIGPGGRPIDTYVVRDLPAGGERPLLPEGRELVSPQINLPEQNPIQQGPGQERPQLPERTESYPTRGGGVSREPDIRWNQGAQEAAAARLPADVDSVSRRIFGRDYEDLTEASQKFVDLKMSGPDLDAGHSAAYQDAARNLRDQGWVNNQQNLWTSPSGDKVWLNDDGSMGKARALSGGQGNGNTGGRNWDEMPGGGGRGNGRGGSNEPAKPAPQGVDPSIWKQALDFALMPIRLPTNILLTGAHLGRVGVGNALAHPTEWFPRVGEYGRMLIQPGSRKAILSEIRDQPLVGGQTRVDIKGKSVDVSAVQARAFRARDEYTLPTVAQKIQQNIPILSRFNQAGQAFLSGLRDSIYNQEALRSLNHGNGYLPDGSLDVKWFKDLYDQISHDTGHATGPLFREGTPGTLAAVGVGPSAWTARLESVLDLVNKEGSPLPWDTGARANAIRNLLGIAGIMLITDTVGQLTGAQVNIPKVGNVGTKDVISPFGGLESSLFKVVTTAPTGGQTKYSGGSGYDSLFRFFGNAALDVRAGNYKALEQHANSFLKGNMGPVAERALNLLLGPSGLGENGIFARDWKGDLYSMKDVKQEAGQTYKGLPTPFVSAYAPIAAQSLWNAYQQWGTEGLLRASPSLTGYEVQTTPPSAKLQEHIGIAQQLNPNLNGRDVRTAEEKASPFFDQYHQMKDSGISPQELSKWSRDFLAANPEIQKALIEGGYEKPTKPLAPLPQAEPRATATSTPQPLAPLPPRATPTPSPTHQPLAPLPTRQPVGVR